MISDNQDIWIVLAAGGEGRRMGGAVRKQYLALDGKRILEHTLERFNAFSWVSGMVLVTPADVPEMAPLQAVYPRLYAIVSGGESRFQSVKNGVAAIPPQRCRTVLIHDAVRPIFSEALCERVIADTTRVGAAIAALPLKGTIKASHGEQALIAQTVNRAHLWEAQTPQGFSYPLLQSAYAQSGAWPPSDAASLTDEAMLFERLGLPVALVEGEETNIKITRPLDLALAEAMLPASRQEGV